MAVSNETYAALVDRVSKLEAVLGAALADAKPIKVEQKYRQAEDCTELVEETTWADWVESARGLLA